MGQCIDWLLIQHFFQAISEFPDFFPGTVLPLWFSIQQIFVLLNFFCKFIAKCCELLSHFRNCFFFRYLKASWLFPGVFMQFRFSALQLFSILKFRWHINHILVIILSLYSQVLWIFVTFSTLDFFRNSVFFLGTFHPSHFLALLFFILQLFGT